MESTDTFNVKVSDYFKVFLLIAMSFGTGKIFQKTQRMKIVESAVTVYLDVSHYSKVISPLRYLSRPEAIFEKMSREKNREECCQHYINNQIIPLHRRRGRSISFFRYFRPTVPSFAKAYFTSFGMIWNEFECLFGELLSSP